MPKYRMTPPDEWAGAPLWGAHTFAPLPAVLRPVVVVTVQMETANRKGLRVEEVAYEDIADDSQLFSPKYIL
jgi:hypothetical protein